MHIFLRKLQPIGLGRKYKNYLNDEYSFAGSKFENGIGHFRAAITLPD
jgi:hypothetical protein